MNSKYAALVDKNDFTTVNVYDRQSFLNADVDLERTKVATFSVNLNVITRVVANFEMFDPLQTKIRKKNIEILNKNLEKKI